MTFDEIFLHELSTRLPSHTLERPLRHWFDPSRRLYKDETVPTQTAWVPITNKKDEISGSTLVVIWAMKESDHGGHERTLLDSPTSHKMFRISSKDVLEFCSKNYIVYLLTYIYEVTI